MKHETSSGAGKIIFLHFPSPTTQFFVFLGLIFVSSHMLLENPEGTLEIINVE